MLWSRSEEGQKTIYFIIPILSSTNTITMFVFRKATVDVYGRKTIVYIIYASYSVAFKIGQPPLKGVCGPKEQLC